MQIVRIAGQGPFHKQNPLHKIKLFGNITISIGDITKYFGGYMLEKLFGNPVIEKILFYLLSNKKGYGTQLSHVLKIPLYSVQKALMRLEDGGIIVAQLEGKTRVYYFNPRYPFLAELQLFLSKAYTFLPVEQKQTLYEAPTRTRPRRTGKPLKQVVDD
jgi:DNA-binding transcriptional ArsR family regulator